MRLPPGANSNALEDDDNYTVIFGSHRNSCLKIEKNLQECYRVSCFKIDMAHLQKDKSMLTCSLPL